MQAKERDYAMSRLQGIYNAKCEPLAEPQAIELSEEEMIDLLRTGKPKVRPRGKLDNWNRTIVRVFDWAPFEKPAAKDIHKVKRERLEAEYQRIKDELMLGDSTAALEAWPDPSSVTTDDAQITAWCTGCHKYYVRSYETTIDYRRMMKIVVDAGYHGYVGIEWEGENPSEVDGVKRTKELLERVRSELSS